MKNRSSNQKTEHRRRFMTSALIGGAGSLLATSSVLGVTESDVPDICGELSAADPLYFYTSLVTKLQPTAIEEGRKLEEVVRTSEAQKLSELWVLSDRLKAQLPKRSNAQSVVERVNSLAYIGQTNAHALSPGDGLRSRTTLRAHAKSQQLIMTEIVKASTSLSRGDVRISAEAWALLQEMLKKIDEIRKFEPEVVRAGEEFNATIKTINNTISGIQSALMEASTSLVKGDKPAAISQVNSAISIIKTLPGYKPAPTVSLNRTISEDEAAVMTPNKFIAMLDPGVFDLINNRQPTPPTSSIRSRGKSEGIRLTPVAYVSESFAGPSNVPLDLQTVKAIVQQFLQSGSWWQVVAVAAVCLPLWSYSRSEHRKSLIYSALTAIPRGPKSRLWEAAYHLDRLRP